MTPADDNVRKMAEKIVGEDDGNKYHGVKIMLVANALRKVRNEAYSRAAEVVRNESELEGPIPAKVFAEVMADPEKALRACVRATKKSIAAAIEALKEGE